MRKLLLIALCCCIPSDGNAQDSFTFGEVESNEVASAPAIDIYSPSFTGHVKVAVGYLPDKNSQSDLTTHTSFGPEFDWQFNEHWSVKLSGDIDHYTEVGTDNYSNIDFSYQENYIRYAGDNLRVTVGPQKVIWGRVDGIKPTDQLGSQDLRTYITDDYEERRRAVPAVRSEYFAGDYKLDGMFVLNLRESEVPDRDSLWRIIDVNTGRVLAVASQPILDTLVKNASFGSDSNGIAGGGLRVSKAGEKADFSVTAQRVKRSLPFYEVNPEITNALLSGASLPAALDSSSGTTLTAKHPWMSVLGGDIAIPVGGTILRGEGVWMSNVPVYTQTLETDYKEAVILVGGAEFYPGDGDLRVIIQGAAQILLNAENALDRNEIYSINGSIENKFAHGRWVANLDYSIGLDEHDVYLNPKLSYLGMDGHEIYGEIHIFDGSPITPGGYYKENSQLMMGWKHEL